MLTCWMLPLDGRQSAGTSHCVFRETSISTPADVDFNQVYALFFVVLHLQRMLHPQSCGYGWPRRQESLQVRIFEKDTILLKSAEADSRTWGSSTQAFTRQSKDLRSTALKLLLSTSSSVNRQWASKSFHPKQWTIRVQKPYGFRPAMPSPLTNFWKDFHGACLHTAGKDSAR